MIGANPSVKTAIDGTTALIYLYDFQRRNSMLKRALAFLTLTVMVLSLLVACGDTTTPTTGPAPAATTGSTATGATTSATSGPTIGAASATAAAGTAATGTTAAGSNATTDKLVSVTGSANRNAVRNFNPFLQAALFCTNNCAFE